MQTTLFKGELMEEKLRQYFLKNGYYVVRSIKYKHKSYDITDIDLFLYTKISSLSRERINVDIKNKRSPKAFERILWTKGLQSLLGFERCVVATSDKNEQVRDYGNRHEVIVFDGLFLKKLNYSSDDRLSEEEFIESLSPLISYKSFKNKNWNVIYEESKSRLLSELDFSGFNSSLITLKYFFRKCFDVQKRVVATRCVYVILSHLLIILDYILKDIAFLEQSLRQETLSDGFNYGNLGREGVNRTIEMAVRITNSNISASSIKQSIDTTETDILKEYFSKTDVTKNIFRIAIDFERYAFERTFSDPIILDASQKTILSIFLDYFQINRKSYFQLYE